MMIFSSATSLPSTQARTARNGVEIVSDGPPAAGPAASSRLLLPGLKSGSRRGLESSSCMRCIEPLENPQGGAGSPPSTSRTIPVAGRPTPPGSWTLTPPAPPAGSHWRYCTTTKSKTNRQRPPGID
eukprot:scaffold259708_cov20-Prasinocladus_malaysianus.AAC.1